MYVITATFRSFVRQNGLVFLFTISCNNYHTLRVDEELFLRTLISTNLSRFVLYEAYEPHYVFPNDLPFRTGPVTYIQSVILLIHQRPP